jgi:GNAT superfamily N-acetyltransferase
MNMTSSLQIIAITDRDGSILAPDWLARAETVHRELRPHLRADYIGRMREVFASGAEMAVAVKGERVLGVTVFRMAERTHSGREMYCDDLVTSAKERSGGVGHALMQYMEKLANERGCDCLTLDSGTQRQQAHKFYFREGMTIPSFHFEKPLKK